eukprot:13812148-Alexandrium_andersonii.AAC.1
MPGRGRKACPLAGRAPPPTRTRVGRERRVLRRAGHGSQNRDPPCASPGSGGVATHTHASLE